jgi:hypothetical protein
MIPWRSGVRVTSDEEDFRNGEPVGLPPREWSSVDDRDRLAAEPVDDLRFASGAFSRNSTFSG